MAVQAVTVPACAPVGSASAMAMPPQIPKIEQVRELSTRMPASSIVPFTPMPKVLLENQENTTPDLRRLPGEPIHLALNQLPIKPFPAHQQVGRAVLDDLAGLQHDDAVEIAHGGEPVRDGDDGAAAHQAGERLADDLLGFAVERRSGFVEQQ